MPLRLRKSLDQPYVVPADKRDLRWWLQQLAARRGTLAAITLVGVAAAIFVTARVRRDTAGDGGLVPPLVTSIRDTGLRTRAAAPAATVAPPAKPASPRTANVPGRSPTTTTPGLAAKSAPAAAGGRATPSTDGRVPTTLGPLEAGIGAYRRASYDEAVQLLHTAIAGGDNETLAPSARTTASMYLGASELSLQRRDSATAAFRTLLANAPRYRPDTLNFSKGVTDFYEGIRRSLHGVARVDSIENGVRVTVFAINPHRVSIEVLTERGTKIVGLYEGPSADSLAVDWDERGADKLPVSNGRYDIVVTARSLSGQLLSVGKFPVVIDRAPETGASRR